MDVEPFFSAFERQLLRSEQVFRQELMRTERRLTARVGVMLAASTVATIGILGPLILLS